MARFGCSCNIIGDMMGLLLSFIVSFDCAPTKWTRFLIPSQMLLLLFEHSRAKNSQIFIGILHLEGLRTSLIIYFEHLILSWYNGACSVCFVILPMGMAKCN